MEKQVIRETRTYNKDYRVEAVKLARQIGPKKASIELGVPDGTISSWMHKARTGAIDMGPGMQTPQSGMTQASEIERLKSENKAMARDNKRLREENAFLEEASAFFAASRRRFARKSDSII
jgi:transposase